ncbi:hypothetical protein [Nocardiopsis sp. NPDC058789]|uniref:hypothetical protein n=1 Tax=Nocardiopsis sp. NPDC058789 TaxID=3346634 RepID=UPI00366E3EA2
MFRGRGEPGIPQDVKVMQQLAIHASKRGVEIDVTTNKDRQRIVFAHQDLADRLMEHPLNYKFPSQWTGYIPPAMWQGQPNNSPRRAALVSIYEEALSRSAQGQVAA